MKRMISRFVLSLAVLSAGAMGSGMLSPRPASSQEQDLSSQKLASVEELKTAAFKALRDGQFGRTNELLIQAASIAKDPALDQMARWTKQFESQRQEFVVERRKQYDKAVADVHLLIDNDKADYAIDVAKGAYVLAEDKTAFRNEEWVDDLIERTVASAADYESSEQWYKAMRLYADLGAIEPANPQWKEKLKLSTRRIRLLAMYNLDALKAIQASETKGQEEVIALLNPTTQPATKPAEDADAESAFKIDWRETLRDIQFPMLSDALIDTRTNYYRDVSYRTLLTGGLNGLEVVATTKGLEKTFSKLAEPDSRDGFIKFIEESLTKVQAATAANELLLMHDILRELESLNNRTVQLPEAVLVSEFADGAFSELDQFTSMIWPSDLEEFAKATRGKFSGVGIHIQTDQDGNLKVASPLEDSPAYKAGIKAGDIISHIDGKSAKNITLNQAVKTITGPPGTSVMLTIRGPDLQVKDYTIRRETIKVPSIKGWTHRPGGGWDYLLDAEQKIGYIRLTNFTETTGDELSQAVEEMKDNGAKAMILDLRYNPGGLLTAATEVTDKFLDEGVIVSTRADRQTPNHPTVASAKADADEMEMPTIVLVNQYSASASEIVSGALKDQKRALIVGERTFGKGSVQMLFPLTNRQAYLKLTTSHYYLPSGRSIHREENSQEWGVDPDVKVEMTPEQMRAAIDARQEMDILRDAAAPPAEGEQEKLQDIAPAVADAVADIRKKDPLASDPQLSAALLLLRLQLAGAQL